MKILISPAKKMREDVDSLPYEDLPAFLPKTEEILKTLQAMSYESLKSLWKCSDAIARQNVQRLEQMDLRHHLTPALLAYEGIQYRYMAPGVFSEQALAYVQQHLRILSGFYGILRPFDGVVPYRLEMQTKLALGTAPDLYAYWGEDLVKSLLAESSCMVNLASKEYSLAVSKYLPKSVPMITCVFAQERDGKRIEKGTLCKMARGEMVRFLAENQIDTPEEMCHFTGLGFHFDKEHSQENTFVFLTESADRNQR